MQSRHLVAERDSLSQTLLDIHASLAPYTQQEGLLGQEFQDVADAYALLCRDLHSWSGASKKV